ncbi:hypothetical protein Tco_0904151 [Tanacetum coccineum]
MGNEKEIEHVFRNWDDSYTALPKFLSALQHFNRDSVVELVHYFDVRRPQGIHAQVSGERYAPHVVAKQEALKLKASAHVVRSFNLERGIFEVITKKGINVCQYVNTCYSIREYCATWTSEFFPLPHEAYWLQSSFVGELLPNSNLKWVKSGHPRSTRIHNGIDIKEGKKKNLCGICQKGGHNRETYQSKPQRMDDNH